MKTFVRSMAFALMLLFNLVGSHAQTFNYNGLWYEVDTCEQDGLPKSALQKAKIIYDQARAEKNYPQFVKAFIHTMKYRSLTTDKAFVQNLMEAERVADSASFPAKPILHSMLGEMYWWYFQNNRYKFYGRTRTDQFTPTDIETWDLQRLISHVIQHYQMSISESDRLKQVKLDDFESIVKYDTSLKAKLSPTLYDFLALRAIKLFSQEEPGLTRPAAEFSMNNDDFFLPVDAFVRLVIPATDTLSYKYQTLKLFQDLLHTHLDDANPETLMLTDLKRLDFVNRNSNNVEKDSLYLNSLYFLEKKCAGLDCGSDIGMLIAEKLNSMSEAYNPRVSEAHKWDRKRAREKALAVQAQKPDDSRDINHFIANIERKDIALTIEKENIPNQAFRALVDYKNADSVYIRVIKTSYEEYSNFVKDFQKRNKRDYYEFDKEVLDFYQAKPTVHQYSVALPNDHDFQNHYAEVKIPALDKGLYFIVAGTNPGMDYVKNQVSYGLTAVTNISFISRNNPKGWLDFYMLNRKTGEPLESVKAECWVPTHNSSKSELSKTYTSDKNGFFQITDTKNNFQLDFSWQGDEWAPRKMAERYSNDWFYNYSYNESGKTKLKTYFFTDRAIYRPGQTIYFKGITFETDDKKLNQIKKNESVAIELMDASDQKVAELKLTTNEFGSFSGSFTAPNKGLNGRMRIRHDDYGSIWISVEDYKRPKFEVTFDTLRSAYKLNETVKISGRAAMYSGAMVDGAEVNYRVVRQTRYAGWFNWWRPRPVSPDKVITNGTLKTKADGSFELSFKAIPDAGVAISENPTFTYTVYADVTDINGETHSAQKDVRAGYKALEVNIDIPAKVDKNGTPKYKLSTRNLNGDFEPASGTITVYKLKNPDRVFRQRKWEKPDKASMTKEEYYRTFPNDPYMNETEPSTWEVEKIAEQAPFNTANEKTFGFSGQNRWKDGSYKLVVNTTDKFGEKVETTSYFTLFDQQSNKLPYPVADWFEEVKSSGEPGETAQLEVGSGYDNARILVEVEVDKQIVQKEWLSLKDQRKLLNYPLLEKYRGNIGLHYIFVRNNRLYTHNCTLEVPYTNKKLDINFETFRNKLQPGEKEQWRLRIKGKTGEQAAAEMVATLYDASLDAIKPHSFNADFWSSYVPQLDWQADNCFTTYNLNNYSQNNPYSLDFGSKYRNELYGLDWFGYGYYVRKNGRKVFGKASEELMTLDEVVVSGYGTMKKSAKRETLSMMVADVKGVDDANAVDVVDLKIKDVNIKPPTASQPDLSNVKARTNLNETAFFFPHLQTDSNGDVLINFTAPEALTRWKMLGFAHTKELAYGFTQNELVTQKDLMVTPNAPRFFREGDTIAFTAKVAGLSDKQLTGTAQLMLFDALTMKPVDTRMNNLQPQQPFSVKKGESANLSWTINIPVGLQAVTYRVVAKAGDFSDGEESSLPVLTNSMLVTETLPLPMKGRGTQTFTLDKLLSNTSTTLRNHKLTLEYTSNPAWYAVQALPYLMEYPYECAEQTFSRFYANSIASHIANSSPKIKQIFDAWKNISPDALLSNLEKNQELKSLMLEETPWVLNAQNESERKQRVALLFDLNHMSGELDKALDKLKKLQTSGGAWPWFAGGYEDRYITQQIVCGMGKLDHLGVKNIRNDNGTWGMVKKAIAYTDEKLADDYIALKRLADAGKLKLSENHIGYSQVHYLYARSFFKDLKTKPETQEAMDYYLGQARKYWLSNGFYMQGMMALALQRYNDNVVPAKIIKSLKEHAITSKEMGMYLKYESGWYWYQAPIETQALMIEAFDEVAHDTASVNEMKVWLLKQKQTQNWKTTKATTEACYALLLRGSDWLATEPDIDISVGSQKISLATMPDLKTEAGTGYFKTSWNGSDIKPDMGKVTVTKNTNGVSWGALYWQYFEQLDKITSSETPLKLKKQLFIVNNTASGQVLRPISDTTRLYPGNLIKVRIELRVDREMEYVHMKDMRAAGLEPVNVLSSYKYQDGLGYYESTRDAATNFFFGWLPKGTYVFEYPLRVTHFGNFSNGITTIQSMYAPEFTSHSEGVRLKVK
ncbi:MAG: alpha-2-macroglobulin family protein [Bacteroidota bacterium]|nr:alpha-2-macroglobulin family protein [Bacteroidota bacterium]